MELNRWKTTLYEWIKATKLIELPGNIESVDIEAFYKEYREKLKDPEAPDSLAEFLNVNFPDFEMHFDDTNRISPLDHMYIFSIILFHACVKQTLVYFQKSCETLCNKHQVTIANFLVLMGKCSTNKENFNKSTLRRVINEAAPPNSPGSVLPFLSIYSPIKTPKVERSPPTPSKVFFDEKMRELKFVKTQLDNERYERGYLEVQLKQTEEKILNFSKEKKKYQNEIQELRNDLLSKETENYSPNKNNRSQEIQTKLRNEIKDKIELVSNLKSDLERLQETIQSNQTRMAYTEKEMQMLKARAVDAEISKDELKEELDKRDEAIKCLSESNQELQTFISETRASMSKDFNGSTDVMDYSFSQISHSTVGLNSTGSGENLGRCVIDLQLKEKENENSKLKELLAEMTTAKESLDVTNEELRLKVASLEAELDALKKSFEQIKEESENFKLTIDELTSKNVNLEHEQKEARSELEQKIASLTSQHDKTEKALHNSIQQIMELENSIELKSEETEQLKISKSSLESQIKDLTTRNKIENDKMQSDLIAGVELAEKQLTNIKTLEDHMADLICDHQKQAIILKDLTEQITVSQGEIKKYDSQVDRLEDVVQKIEKEKSALIITIQSKQEELESLTKENEENVKQVAAGNQKVNNLSSLVEILEVKLEKFKDDLSSKDQLVAKLETNIVALESEVKLTNESKLELAQQLNQTKTDLEHELLATQEKFEQVSAEVSVAQIACKESRERVEQLEEIEKSLQSELADEIQVRALVSAEVKDQDVQLMDLKNQLSEQKQETMILQTNLKAIDEQKLQLEEKLSAITVELEEKIQVELQNDKMMEQNHEQIKELQRLLEENGERSEKLLASVETTKQKLKLARENYQQLSDKELSLEKLLVALTDDKQLVEANNKSLKDTVEQKCIEIDGLLVEIKDKDEKMICQVQEIAKIKEESIKVSETGKSLIVEKESKIQELEQQIQDLITSINTKDETCKQVQQQIEIMEQKSTKTFAENAETIQKKELEIKALTTQIDELNSLIGMKDGQINEEHKTSSTTIQEKEELISSLQQQISDEQHSTEETIKQLHSRIQENNESFAQAVELNANNIQEKENLIQILTQESLALKASIEQNDERFQKMQEESAAIIEVNTKIIQEKDNLIQQHSQEIQNFTASIQAKIETSQNLQDEITTIQEESAKFTKINATTIQQQELEIQELTNKAQTLETEVTNLKSSVEQKSFELSQLKEETDSKEALVLQQEAEAHQFADKIKEIEDQLQAKLVLENELVQKNQNLAAKSVEHEKMVENLKLALNKVTEAKNNIKEQCDAVVEEKNSLYKSNHDLSAKVMSLKTRLVDQETKISDLEMQTTSLKENMQHHIELKLTLENLETKHSMIKERAEDLELSVEQLLKEKQTLERENEDLIENRVIGATKLEEKCNFLKSELEQKQNDLDEMIRKADSTLKVVKQLEEDKSSLNQAFLDLEASKKLSDDKIIELTNTQSAIYQEINAKADKTTEILADKEKSMLELTHQLNDLKSQMNQRATEISALESSKAELKSQNQELMAKFENGISGQDVLQQKLAEQEQKIELVELKLQESSALNNKLAEDKNELQMQMDRIDVENHRYKDQLALLQRDLSCTKETLQQENAKTEDLSKHFEELKRKDRELAELKLKYDEERKFNDANSADTKILHCKLLLERQKKEESEKEWLREKKLLQSKIEEEKRLSEEKVKDNRLEMDGKLEKMKDKMKTLYNEEMSKKKEKHERDVQEVQLQNAKLAKKMQLLEQHTEKLSKQIYQLNDSQLEYQKENEYMKNKLRFMEKTGNFGGSTTSIGSAFKPTTTTHNSQHKGQFTMEDEEGELFNNTYLGDLKSGGDPYSFLELQQRNSMMLPHMRSSYAVTEIDNKNFNEEDIKDGGLLMDDSSSSLLQNGLRKKQSTSYKRPGPPTPSKNAGRLSIGPNDVQYKEIILKDSTNENVQKKSTPGRFKNFITGGTKPKDENSTPKRRLSFFQSKKQSKY